MKTFLWKHGPYNLECHLGTSNNLFWFATKGEKVVSDGWLKVDFDVFDHRNDARLDEYFKTAINEDER